MQNFFLKGIDANTEAVPACYDWFCLFVLAIRDNTYYNK